VLDGYEHDVIAFLKQLWCFPENEKDWGSSCSGSSEAVLSAILYARERFAGHNLVVYCKKEARYCVKNNTWITGLSDCTDVEVLQDRGMNTADLKLQLEVTREGLQL
jgi:glutamate/tyrosine decarboxylase-like PLP-dependent enzyme